jgi:hypothetical protein
MLAMSVRTPIPSGALPRSGEPGRDTSDIRGPAELTTDSGASEANGMVRMQVPFLTSRLSLPSATPGCFPGDICLAGEPPDQAVLFESRADRDPAATAYGSGRPDDAEAACPPGAGDVVRGERPRATVP